MDTKHPNSTKQQNVKQQGCDDVPYKHDGIWHNCYRGMRAIGIKRNQPYVLVLLQLVRFADSSHEDMRTQAWLGNRQQYDVWTRVGIVPGPTGGPLVGYDQQTTNNFVAEFVNRTGIPKIEGLSESDRASTFELQIELATEGLSNDCPKINFDYQ